MFKATSLNRFLRGTIFKAALGCFLITLTCATAWAESEEIGKAGNWTLFAQRSIMDGKIMNVYAANHSLNTVRSSGDYDRAILFVRMTKTGGQLFIGFPEALKAGSAIVTKIDQHSPSDSGWSVQDERYAAYTGENFFNYFQQLDSASEFAIEVSNNDRILYQAKFNIEQLHSSMGMMLDYLDAHQ